MALIFTDISSLTKKILKITWKYHGDVIISQIKIK